MNGITVPKQYRSELRDDRTPEYKIACIRDYVNAHTNEIITMADFVEIAGSTAQTYVKKLLNSGDLIRFSIKNGKKGHSYGYRWIEHKEKEIENDTDGVKTRSLGFEPFPLGTDAGNLLLDDIIDHYVVDNVENLAGDEIKGMIKLKKHVRSEYDRVKQQRADKLTAHQKGGNDE
jgi:hypothetical protein